MPLSDSRADIRSSGAFIAYRVSAETPPVVLERRLRRAFAEKRFRSPAARTIRTTCPSAGPPAMIAKIM
jgi:hypothetical protein